MRPALTATAVSRHFPQVEYSPVGDAGYQPDRCPHCTLFGGTVVKQAKAGPRRRTLAVAVRTRFYSAKVRQRCDTLRTT